MHKINEAFWMFCKWFSLVCCLSFDFVHGIFVTQKLLVWIESSESFMVSGFCGRFRTSIILEY